MESRKNGRTTVQVVKKNICFFAKTMETFLRIKYGKQEKLRENRTFINTLEDALGRTK